MIFPVLLTTCSRSDIDVYLPCFVLPSVSVPHMSFCLHSYCIHQILDSVSYAHQHDIVHRDLKVCVSLCLCACTSAFHFSAFVLTLRAMVALHMPVLICVADLPVPAICPSICLSLFFLPCLSARLQALHLGLCLHYFGWSEAETRVLADIIL